MRRVLVSLVCLLVLPALRATGDTGSYHWSPGFYRAGVVSDLSPHTDAGVDLTCEPGAEGTRLRLVARGLAVDTASSPPSLDIDVDDRRFRVQGAAVDGQAIEIVVPADPAIVKAITRGETLTLAVPETGQTASFDLAGAAPAIADMIGDCAEFTPEWCARRIVMLGQPARAGASAIRPEHRLPVEAALGEDYPDPDFDAGRALEHSCSAYFDLNNDGQSELLVYLRTDPDMRFAFHVFSGVNGDFREVLHEEIFSPRFVVWSFVPARWGGWLDLVTQDVQLVPDADPDDRVLIGHIFTWDADSHAYATDWVSQTPCHWPDCEP